MATVSITLSKEVNKLIHRPVYKGVVCYTHPDGYMTDNNAPCTRNAELAKLGLSMIDGDGQVEIGEIKQAIHKYMNSPGNIRRLYITYKGVVVLYYTSFIENGQRSTRGHWVARPFKNGLDIKNLFFKMISYQSEWNKYNLERQVNKRAKEPDVYTVKGSFGSILTRPWSLSNLEEIYFDWIGLMSTENEPQYGGRFIPEKYNVIYNILNGNIKPQIAHTDAFVSNLVYPLGCKGLDRDDNWQGPSRNSFPRLRTVTFVSNLGDILFDPSIPIDKVDSEFTDVSKAGVMWYRSPQNVEIFKRTGSVVWYYDTTKDLKVRNTNFSKKPGIYLFDDKYLTPVFDSYVQKINDYNNKLKYGDKTEEIAEEAKAESSESTSSRLDELVDRVVKARGPQAASYILRVAATGYSSKEIHGLIKSASESNQPAIKRYMGVN